VVVVDVAVADSVNEVNLIDMHRIHYHHGSYVV
jgi:hypothetical protein